MGFNVRLLEHSFALVAPKGDVLVATFYRHVQFVGRAKETERAQMPGREKRE
jgi:hypothetical protein